FMLQCVHPTWHLFAIKFVCGQAGAAKVVKLTQRHSQRLSCESNTRKQVISPHTRHVSHESNINTCIRMIRNLELVCLLLYCFI
ncbi:hypothetical protein VIGAN_01426000, partial [Vigna angularis var. angularis]